MVPDPPPDEGDDLDDVLGLGPQRRASTLRRTTPDRGVRPRRSEPPRRWDSGEDDEAWEDVVDDRTRRSRRRRTPVFWRARDSLYFEPLVALAIIVLLLVSLFAYTSNWPPVYVVESNSMQHGAGDHLGYINAGDIVLAQKAGLGSIVTYEEALTTGFSTYGELGDVILYDPNGASGSTPIVHRAIVYLQYDGHNSTWNVTGLPADGCGAGSAHYYATQGTASGCGTSGLSAAVTLSLYDVGGRTVTVDFGNCPAVLGPHSGFLTLGDNNTNPDQNTVSCAHPLSTLVEPGWVIGVARGLIPWFGDLKLLLDGNAANVSGASWEYLGITVAAVIFAGVGLHVLAKRRRDAPRASRRPRDELDDDEPEARSVPRREREGVQPWRPTAGAVDDDEPRSARATYAQRRRAHFASTHEARSAHRRPKSGGAPDEPDSSQRDG